jgi:tetratricopeptide (TPR) repeat protein
MPAPNAVGHALFERIGVGGMGEVYRCGDDALQRDLAIKVIKAELRGRDNAEERFVREARITGSLQHPGIVPIHHLGRLADGRLCYTMKLVRGRTLADMLRDEADGLERLPHLLTIVEKVCQAVAYAHIKGVIHRDLKPSNVMVGKFGEVQVMDWGLAKVLSREDSAGRTVVEEEAGTLLYTTPASPSEDMSRTGAAMGTPSYMPPEQAMGERELVDERADVFALGAILCELLTGFPPYRGGLRDELLRRARRGDLAEALGRLERCGADAALVDLCRDCLAAAREGRPRHAGVVAERLASYHAEVRERLRQAELERARAEVQAQEERKRRRLRAALVLAALLLLSGGALVWWRQDEAARASAVRQAEANGAATQVMREASLLVEQARADPLSAAGSATYEKAVLAASKAGDVARAGASEAVRRQAEQLRDEMQAEAEAAARDRRLLARLLETRGPREGPKFRRDDKGMTALAEPTAEEQFSSAFRDWGLDVDATPAAESAARLKARPAAVVTEVIAALDEWAIQRRMDGKPDAEWRRVAELAAALDAETGSLRRELREILGREQLPVERALGVLSAALRPVPVPAAMPLGRDCARLRQLAGRVDPAGEPVLAFLTLTRALRVAGEEEMAERFLRAALTARPREVVLYHTLGQLLQEQPPPRWSEAAECYAAARALRPDLGVALAVALLKSARAREARELLARLVKENPDNPFLLCMHGVALYEQSDPDGAIACFKKALDLNPRLAHPHILLGTALADKHDLDGAITCFRKALDLQPKDAQAHYSLGLALYVKGDLDGVIACYKQTLALDPKYAEAHYNLGNVLRDKGDLDGAMACYKKALAIDPKLAPAHNNLGNVLRDKGDLDGAMASYQKSLDLHPKDVMAHSNRGSALYAKGDLDGAIASFQKALDLDPRLVHAHSGLGLALADKGDLDGAIACYKKALTLDPKDAPDHNNLGKSLYAKGDLDGAIASFRKAIDIDPRLVQAHNNLGTALADKGELDGAIACYKTALTLAPRLALAHYNLGLALADKGDPDGAIACYKKAIQLDPEYAQPRVEMGQVLLQQGRYAAARESTRRALELLPTDAPPRLRVRQQLQLCETMLALDQKLPAILRNEVTPSNPGEAVALASMCLQPCKKRYAAAARLYADAFAAEPKLATDSEAGHRYNAASSAVLAAAGQGEDARLLPDKVVTMFRRWALDWLRADLAAYAKLAGQNNLALKQTIQQRLAHWRQDPDIASVREPHALERLPENERAAWRALWRDVDEISKKDEPTRGRKETQTPKAKP